MKFNEQKWHSHSLEIAIKFDSLFAGNPDGIRQYIEFVQKCEVVR